MSATVNLAFELTPGGLEQAQAELDRIRGLFEQRGAGGAKASERVAGEILYSECQGRLSRELLKLLPDRKEDALTFAELGEKMTADDGHSKLDKTSVRAAYRNVKRVENRLGKAGEIDDQGVIQVDYDRYGAEGANHYYLRPEDRAAIDELVKDPK